MMADRLNHSNRDNGGFAIATFYGPDAPANAELTALAPEMAEALRECAVLLDMAFNHDSDVFRKHHNDATDTDSRVRSILARLPPC